MLTAAHRTLYQQVMDLTAAGRSSQDIATIVTSSASQVFDLLEPALANYAVNAFEGKVEHDLDDVRCALDVAEHVPLIVFDARKTGSVRDALLAVLERALARAEAG